MSPPTTLPGLLATTRILPVMTVKRATDALPWARALAAAGLTTIEITLRTPEALAAIDHISSRLPAITVGAGTVTRPEELDAVEAAGARFAVSPGLTPDLAEAAESAAIPLIPGVATPSEAMAARDRGFELLKLFPAEPLGGRDFLRSLAGPLPELKFCPTGGIGPDSCASYLALPNVVCVGGSWMLSQAEVDQGDWEAVERRAHAAFRLAEEAR